MKGLVKRLAPRGKLTVFAVPLNALDCAAPSLSQSDPDRGPITFKNELPGHRAPCIARIKYHQSCGRARRRASRTRLENGGPRRVLFGRVSGGRLRVRHADRDRRLDAGGS